MSNGLDQELVREYYQRMTDTEVIHVLTQEWASLTTEAQEIMKAEVSRRKFDLDLTAIIESQPQVEILESKVYDPDGCPVDEDIRVWLEQSFQTLLSLFGLDNTLGRKVLIPENDHFPIQYDGSERSAFETLRVVATQMEVPAELITLDFYDEKLRQITEGTPGGFYWGKGENGNFEISLARKELDEPENMVAVLAHEIAHIKLLGENRMEENDERVTDLATIFFGLGVFNANAAFRTDNDARYYRWSQTGYLTQMEWGYALALFAYIRGEQAPAWFDYLCKNVKGDFLQGQKWIYANEELVFPQEQD